MSSRSSALSPGVFPVQNHGRRPLFHARQWALAAGHGNHRARNYCTGRSPFSFSILSNLSRPLQDQRLKLADTPLWALFPKRPQFSHFCGHRPWPDLKIRFSIYFNSNKLCSDYSFAIPSLKLAYVPRFKSDFGDSRVCVFVATCRIILQTFQLVFYYWCIVLIVALCLLRAWLLRMFVCWCLMIEYRRWAVYQWARPVLWVCWHTNINILQIFTMWIFFQKSTYLLIYYIILW